MQHNWAQVATHACHSYDHLNRDSDTIHDLTEFTIYCGRDTAQGYVLVHNSFAFTLARKNWPPNYIILMRSALKFLYIQKKKSVQNDRPAGGADLYLALVVLRILCML